MVYFKDSEGTSAYSIGDMPLSISKSDIPEAEIGTSTTTTEILEIESDKILKGSSALLLKAASKGKGSSTITVESSIKDILFSTTNTLTMNTQLPEKLGFFIPNLILGNAKSTVPLQVLDKDGFPIKTVNDVEIMFVPSLRNVVSAPQTIVLPKGEYYTTLLIEARDDGLTEITALANNFQSTKLNVKVTTPQLTAALVPSTEVAKMDDEFTVTLDLQYSEIPIRNLNVKWSSDKATLLQADEFTNELGSAEAKFVMREASPFVVKADFSGPGYKNSTTILNMETESIVELELVETEKEGELVETEKEGGPTDITSIVDIFMKNPHFFLPFAIGAVLFWLVKTERISLPFDRLRESLPFNRLLARFRKDED